VKILLFLKDNNINQKKYINSQHEDITILKDNSITQKKDITILKYKSNIFLKRHTILKITMLYNKMILRS